MLSSGPLPTDVGEWHQFRGDQQLTGRAELAGNITEPEVLWSEFIGARTNWISVSAGGGVSEIVLPDEDRAIADAALAAWQVGDPLYDLDGNGQLTPIPLSENRQVGDFLPDSPGLEQIEFDPGFNELETRGRLLRRVDGQWATVWETDPIEYLYSSNDIVGDFDGDRRDDIAVLSWYDLHLFDLSTGTPKGSARFSPSDVESGRGYGWFGALDVDRDGRDEFIVLGDFQNFISVIGWDQSNQLVKLWDHTIESALINKATVHRPGASPVQDIDGDGELEIVTSIFNEAGDNRWHVVAFNGLNGEIELDMTDRYLTGMLDVDSDYVAELFVTQTTGLLIPDDDGQIEIVGFDQSAWTTIWRRSGAGFETAERPRLDLNVNENSTNGRVDLIGQSLAPGQNPTFFTREVSGDRDTTTIRAWRADILSGVVESVGSMIGAGLEILAIRAAPGDAMLMVGGEMPGAGATTIGLDGFELHQIEYSGIIGPPRASPVVGRLQGDEADPIIVLQGAGEQILALKPNSADGSAALLWQHDGRGAQTGVVDNFALMGQHEIGSVALADLAGDGTLMTIAATRGPDGQAQLIALRPDGSEFWTANFDGFPGATPLWNYGGLTTWVTGNFRDADRDDVMVNLRRGASHTDELFLLDGLTGEVVWSRTWGDTPDAGGFDPLPTRGAAGTLMAVYDWDGDGLDEAINFYPDVFYVIDGEGDNAIDRALGYDTFPGSTPYYGFPVIDDFLGNGTDTMLFAGNRQVLGLLYPWADPVWSTPFNSGTPAFIQGVGDIDGDGDLDIISVGQATATGDSEMRVYDAATGDVLWSLPLPGSPSHQGVFADSPTSPAMADLDGDGRYEAVFAIGPTLFAVGTDAAGTGGEIKWTMSFAGDVSSPIIADADGDGQIQIIVTCTDGYAYGIGSTSPMGAADVADEYHANNLVVVGTAGDDVFTFTGGAAPFYSVNGTRFDITDPHVTSLLFDGHGGNDRAELAGTASVGEIEFQPDVVTLFETEFIVRTSRVPNVTVTSNSANMDVRMYDSTGDDEFFLQGTTALMKGDGFEHTVLNAAVIYAFASLGADVAHIDDSPRDDTLIATADFVYLTGDGFYDYAGGFDLVYATATGGVDWAYLYDTPGDDVLYATPDYVYLTGDRYFNQASGFDVVNAAATGGIDRANLYRANDSHGHDVSAGSAYVSGNGFYNYAHGFDVFNMYAAADYAGADAIGVHRGSNATFYLDANRSDSWNGAADESLSFGAIDDTAIVGDWNSDGVDQIGVYRASTATFYLDLNGNGQWDGQPTDVSIVFGAVGDWPVIGDWNGDGVDQIGVYRPATSTFYLDLNGNGAWDGAAADRIFQFGAAHDLPIAGDWNGDGRDDIGVYRPASAAFYRDANGNGQWDAGIDVVSLFGAVNDIPVIGDWNGDRVDQIGVYRRNGTFYRDLNDNGAWDESDSAVVFGAVSDVPLVGGWRIALLIANNMSEAQPESRLEAPVISPDQLTSSIAAAIDLRSNTGLDASQIETLRQTEFHLSNLPGPQLGAVFQRSVVIDWDGAGSGWYLDETPFENEEFDQLSDQGLVAAAESAAWGHFDLLTVILHELGHVPEYYPHLF